MQFVKELPESSWTNQKFKEEAVDTTFFVAELSDAMRRGVRFFSVAGVPLKSIDDALTQFINDGNVAMDKESAVEPVSH